MQNYQKRNSEEAMSEVIVWCATNAANNATNAYFFVGLPDTSRAICSILRNTMIYR